MILSMNQKLYIEANGHVDMLMVSTPSLIYNKLMWGNAGIEPLYIYTPIAELDGLRLGDVHLESNHFSDGAYCSLMDEENRLWLPTAERALVDTIAFLDNNYIEGPLIESLQTYVNEHDDLSELYKVARYYKVSKNDIDYWIREAREEGDMSMG